MSDLDSLPPTIHPKQLGTVRRSSNLQEIVDGHTVVITQRLGRVYANHLVAAPAIAVLLPRVEPLANPLHPRLQRGIQNREVSDPLDLQVVKPFGRIPAARFADVLGRHLRNNRGNYLPCPG